MAYRPRPRPAPRTPLRAIRAKCMACCLDQPAAVRDCPAMECPLHPWRAGRKPVPQERSALQTIRQKCLHDCGEANAYAGVRECPATECPLHPWRLGKRPVILQTTPRLQAAGALESCAGVRILLPVLNVRGRPGEAQP